MLLINKNVENTIVVTVTEKVTIANPYWLFSFYHFQSGQTENVILSNTSTQTQRYDKFTLIEGTTVTLLSGEHELKIYAQTSSTNLDPTLANELCQTMLCKVAGEYTQDDVYSVSDEEDEIYDPNLIAADTYLLQENGDFLLLESGDKIILE